MKLLFSEYPADYSHYRYPYQVWALREPGDSLDSLYAAGFLPMRHEPHLFYLNRSVRIKLSDFSLSSENRRIIKKTGTVTLRSLPLADFTFTPSIQKTCLKFSRERIKPTPFGPKTIKDLFSARVYNTVLVYTNEQHQGLGYAVAMISKKCLHYAHPFYDPNTLTPDFGGRMMLEAITYAQTMGCDFVYLGSAYSTTSLYKADFKGVEFFTGFSWSANLPELKYLIGRNNADYLLKDGDYLQHFNHNLASIIKNQGITYCLP